MEFSPQNDGRILAALGYTHQLVPAHWEDIGDAENGPKLDGHPDMDVWSLRLSPTQEHVITVVDEEIVEDMIYPVWDDIPF